MEVNAFTRRVDPERERLHVEGIDPDEPLEPLTEPMLWLRENELICSFPHQVELVEMAEYQKGRGNHHAAR
jgi:hypothetical protein